MSDSIIISRLAIYAHHGVYAEEKRLGQRFFVSLTCTLDLRPAGRNDRYSQTVGYGTLAQLVHEIATTRRFRIAEGLAEAIAAEVLAAFPRIETVTVRVEKPEAPVPLIFDSIAVEITRSRNG
jgi:dihydroneopterin aldolase